MEYKIAFWVKPADEAEGANFSDCEWQIKFCDSDDIGSVTDRISKFIKARLASPADKKFGAYLYLRDGLSYLRGGSVMGQLSVGG